MAVDYYVDPRLATSTTQNTPRLQRGLMGEGTEKRRLTTSFLTPTTDGDGSIYRLFTVPSTIIISSIVLANDAMAGFTSFSMGLYLPKLLQSGLAGTVLNAALFSTGLTFAAAHNSFVGGLDGLAALPPQTVNSTSGKGNCNSMLYELLGETVNGNSRYAQFDIVLTATTRGATAGNVAVAIDYTMS